MTFNQWLYEGVIESFGVFLNEFNLTTNEILLVLEDKLWECINDLNDITSLDLVLPLQQVKEPYEVSNPACKDTTAMLALNEKESAI